MPRQARLDAPGTLHHVMVRGIDGVEIFRDDKDREDFLSRIEHLVDTTGTRILAWVLMDNHIHVLNEDKGSALDIGQDAQVGSHGRIFRGKAHGTAFAH